MGFRFRQRAVCYGQFTAVCRSTACCEKKAGDKLRYCKCGEFRRCLHIQLEFRDDLRAASRVQHSVVAINERRE